jgi:hypothetical protein
MIQNHVALVIMSEAKVISKEEVKASLKVFNETDGEPTIDVEFKTTSPTDGLERYAPFVTVENGSVRLKGLGQVCYEPHDSCGLTHDYDGKMDFTLRLYQDVPHLVAHTFDTVVMCLPNHPKSISIAGHGDYELIHIDVGEDPIRKIVEALERQTFDPSKTLLASALEKVDKELFEPVGFDSVGTLLPIIGDCLHSTIDKAWTAITYRPKSPSLSYLDNKRGRV